MQTRTDKRGTRYAFTSLAELARYLDNTTPTWPYKDSRTGPCTESWDLRTGYDKALELAHNGWIDGAQRAQEALKAFTPTTPKPNLKNDFYGHTPNVPRFCAGAPDSMIRHTREADHGAGAVLTLVVPINAHCGTDARYMANFGLAVAQYVNQLEADGIRVELVASLSQEFNRRYRTTHTWVVKHADQQLDLAVVAFAIGHPAMFRRLCFALIERSAAQPMSNYGYPKETVLKDLIDPAPGTYVLNGMGHANNLARTPEAALEYITREIETAIANAELPA